MAWFQGHQRLIFVVAVVSLIGSAATCIYRIWDVSYMRALPTWQKTETLVVEEEVKIKPIYTGPADLAMSYGEFARPAMDGLTLMASLPIEYVPSRENGRRLVVVGDIHGMDDELAALLKQVDFNLATDHLVAAGDMVNKGPNSNGVITRLMALNASAVRGNHEDRVLLARAEAESRAGISAELASPDAEARRGEAEHLAVARRLSPEQVAWLSKLPVILTVNPLPICVVHAGLVPGIRLDKQDPWAVMNMRTLRYPREELRRGDGYHVWRDASPAPAPGGHRQQNANDGKVGVYDDVKGAEPNRDVAVPVEDNAGEKWADAWNRQQQRVSETERRTVIYGHDSKRGFVEGKHTFGLDSGCVKGGALTAMVIEGTGGGGFRHVLRQESCDAPSRSSG